jgi:N-methylhydantoinase A
LTGISGLPSLAYHGQEEVSTLATRIGVDVGGTFTDLIFFDDETSEVRVGKEPTTPTIPEEGVMEAVARVVSSDTMQAVRYFLHGTTVGLNSLLTRTGAKVGLLATRGFRDVIEIRRGDRDEMFNLFWKMPPPLVPRHLRLPVTERIRHDGSVDTRLDEEDVYRAVDLFDAEGVDCVAVAFLNSYANPSNELAAERALRAFGFQGEISLSHRVSGEYREYERTCTTLVDAYVRPRMTRYLRTLEDSLRENGFTGRCLVTRSGGGAMTFTEGEARPFETILSGPVAGAEGAAELARNLGLGDVISADVGGTSFDTCLILGGRPQVMYEGKVVGLPLQTTWVDVQSIGAGGGSIAHVDVGGFLKVGPQSAGADPGPAAYGRGGTQPTVTDAALALGMLAGGELAGGVRLDVAKARAALVPLGERLGFELEEVARGVLRIATANMAHAIREITIERGHDPRRVLLMAFGGAGPLFGCLLARDLEIQEIVIPPYAGNFSAWGLLGADLTQTAARTRITPLADRGVDETNRILVDLFAELDNRTGKVDGARLREVHLDMRYVGQEHYLTVGASSVDGRVTATEEELREDFTLEYERSYRHTMDEAVEIVNVRATVRTPLPRRAEEFHLTITEPSEGSLRAYSFTTDQWLEFAVREREALSAGTVLNGSAILIEETATTYLDVGFVARVDSSGCLFVSNTFGEA